MFSNENETSGGHISSTTASWEVPLGFLGAPGFPLQKIHQKLENLENTFLENREITFFLLHFSVFDVFLKGEPRGIQNPKRDLPKSSGTRDMAAGSFNFIGKQKGGPNKNLDFLNLRFSDPLRAQKKSPQKNTNIYYLRPIIEP